MRIAVDTNVLAYFEGADDDRRQGIADEVLNHVCRDHVLVVALQVSGELLRVLRRKMKLGESDACATVRGWQDMAAEQPETTIRSFKGALELVERHAFDIWDAVILATAVDAEARLLLSEDMQDGFVWRGTTVVNPFAEARHPLLVDALRG